MYTRWYLIVCRIRAQQLLSCCTIILWAQTLIESRWCDSCGLLFCVPDLASGIELSICIVRIQKVVRNVLAAIKSCKGRLFKECVWWVAFDTTATVNTWTLFKCLALGIFHMLEWDLPCPWLFSHASHENWLWRINSLLLSNLDCIFHYMVWKWYSSVVLRNVHCLKRVVKYLNILRHLIVLMRGHFCRIRVMEQFFRCRTTSSIIIKGASVVLGDMRISVCVRSRVMRIALYLLQHAALVILDKDNLIRM